MPCWHSICVTQWKKGEMCCKLRLFASRAQLGDLQHELSFAATFSHASTKSKASTIKKKTTKELVLEENKDMLVCPRSRVGSLVALPLKPVCCCSLLEPNNIINLHASFAFFCKDMSINTYIPGLL